MKKNIISIVLLVISLSFLLSGCIEVDVNIGIDENFTAILSYQISLDAGAVDMQHQDVLKRAMHSIGWYYQENLNFIVELNLDSEPYMMIMTRRVENSSFEQAYQSLENMLTNEEMTLFMEIDMAFQSSGRQSRYIFNAVADIPKIMQLSNAEELTPELQQQFKQAVETGEGNVTLTLPASEVISSVYPVQMRDNQAVMSVPLSFNSQTEIELSGVVNLLEDGTPGGSIDEILREQNKFREISIILCGAALVIIIILIPVLIFAGRKRKRQRNYSSERS